MYVRPYPPGITPPPPPRIYPFSTTIILCDPPRIYPSLPESTPLFDQFKCATTTICDPPEYTPPEYTPFSTTVCDLPKIYTSLPEYRPTLLFNKSICATLPESTPPSKNIPPFSTTICDPPRIYPSFPEYIPFLTNVCATLA